MSKEMDVVNPEGMVNGIRRNGRAFQHQQELYRDASLNGATHCMFDIERQAIGRSVHRAARRMVWDDGFGMDKDTFLTVYGELSVSATAMVSPYLPLDPDPELHSRYGQGGRATVIPWNGYGYTTITIRDGEAWMMQIFRTLEGKYARRDLPLFLNGIELDDTSTVVPPYVEQEWIAYDSDPKFSEVLLNLGMETAIDGATGETLIKNPEFGLDWCELAFQSGLLSGGTNKTPPIADRYEVDDSGGYDKVIYYSGNDLAHGTIKVMMGNSPDDDTAVMGDPFFPIERDADDYSAWLHQNMWEMPIKAMVWGLFPRKSVEKHTTFELEVTDPNTGMAVTNHYAAQHREPLGAKAHYFGESGEHLEYESPPLQVDEFGTICKVHALKEGTPGLAVNWSMTSRTGTVGTYYNNELYELDRSADLYRKLGISNKDLRSRLFFIFTPPLADNRPATAHEGVFNDQSRGGLLWTGAEKIHRRYPTWASNYLHQEPDEIKVMKGVYKEAVDNIDDPEFRKKYMELFHNVAEAFKKGVKPSKRPPQRKPTWLVDKNQVPEPAHIEGRGSDQMTDEGKQGQPGDTKAPPLKCDICNPDNDPDIHRHDPDCPNKPEPKDNPTDTGTKGLNAKGVPDKNGTVVGGGSQAVVRRRSQQPGGGTTPQRQDLLPPEIVPEVFGDEERWYIFAWKPHGSDDTVMRHAGDVLVNIDLAAVTAWLGELDQGMNVARPQGCGNQYLINELETYVTESPEYEPEDVVKAVYTVYCDTVRQQVIVAIAHKANKMPLQDIKDSFLTAQALTAGALAQADMKARIKAKISLLARRGAGAVPVPVP